MTIPNINNGFIYGLNDIPDKEKVTYLRLYIIFATALITIVNAVKAKYII
jgi:hypothetical protein